MMILGYGWAGMLRRYPVDPIEMWWPSNLAQCFALVLLAADFIASLFAASFVMVRTALLHWYAAVDGIVGMLATVRFVVCLLAAGLSSGGWSQIFH
ncbi:hypothetical protein U1Q18_000622 [Sarracenia purpurea var. burkii]